MSAFAQTLKKWRKVRRFSQLDLATEAGISGRHLSFLETGRAHPSRGMVLRLSETLQLPLDARNQILTHAGFAALHGNRKWSDEQMAPVRHAIDRMLQNHMPYPGLVLDRMWTIIQTNQTADALFGHLGTGIGDCLIDLLLSDAMPGLVENWPDVAQSAAARLRIESSAQGGIEKFEQAAAHLYQGMTDTGTACSPVIPTVMRLGQTRLSMFATLAQMGTPDDVALDDLKIELYFPLDAETRHAFQTMAGG